MRRDPNRTVIPGVVVDAVVEQPFACHPSFAQGYYDRDNDFYVKWEQISKDPSALDGVARRVGLRALEPRRVPREARAAVLERAQAGRGPQRRGQLRGLLVSGDGPRTSSLPQERDDDRGERPARSAGERICFVGVGLPNIVCNLAQRTVAPELQLVYEAGRVRRAARAAAAVDRRPDARDRLDRGHVDVRAVRLLPPGGADRRGVPRRRADRSVRQPQHDGDRRLRGPEGPAARARAAPARSRSTRGGSS